jgi:hypothetical protein
MANDPTIPLKPKKVDQMKDALDLEALWIDPKLGDGLTRVQNFNIPIGKPKEFFRVVPDPNWRRVTEIYTHKVEGQVEEEHYIVAPAMRGVIEEARRATLVTVVYRDGSLRLWPLKMPKDDEKDNEAWKSARAAAKEAMTTWIKIVWTKRAYHARTAQPGYAPDPDYDKLPPFDELITLAFKEGGIIRDRDHPIARDLFGHAPKKPDGGDDGLS